MAKLSTLSDKDAYTMICRPCKKAYLNGQKYCPTCQRELVKELLPDYEQGQYEIGK